jgi:hypothetical protein
MSALLLALLLAAAPAPEKFGCASLRPFDGLLPNVAAFQCDYQLPDPDDPGDQRFHVPGIRVIGNGPWGPPRVTICLLIDNGSGPELITTREEFLRRFAPVETPEEARAFVDLLTGLTTNDVKGAPLPIVETDEGFVIHDFIVPSVGCEIKPPLSTTLTVKRDGSLVAGEWKQLPE